MVVCFRQWLERNPNAIQSGWAVIDQGVTSLLQTSMFLGGMIGMILDNTIPGEDGKHFSGLFPTCLYLAASHFQQTLVSQ